MLKILITGGLGFIARNLSENLKDRYEIVATSRNELDLLNSEEVLDYLKNNKFEVVIHTATYDAAAKFSIKDPTMVLENNLKMFFNLTRGKKYFGKLIYFGSGAEFDREHWIPKVDESYFDKYVPSDQYGFSKYIMTKYALACDNIYNLRLFGMYGKYDDWRTRVIPNLCCLAIMGKPLTIEQNKYYDFLYIDDLVKIVEWFILNTPKEKIYNVCTGNVIDFKTVAEKIVKFSGKELPIVFKTEGLGKEYSGDNSLLLSEMKGFKFTSIDDGIMGLYDWYEKNQNDIFKINL